MFTQEQSIHIGRCNGCNRRCKLGVQAVVLYDNYINFRPTKNGQPIPHYRDKSGKKHFITTYVSATVALSHAYTAVKSCKHYVAPPQPVAQTFTDTQCHGCECKCTLAAQHISTQNRDGFLPVIGTKTITKYKNKRGLTKNVPYYESQDMAIKRARHISNLCDNYQR